MVDVVGRLRESLWINFEPGSDLIVLIRCEIVEFLSMSFREIKYSESVCNIYRSSAKLIFRHEKTKKKRFVLFRILVGKKNALAPVSRIRFYNLQKGSRY